MKKWLLIFEIVFLMTNVLAIGTDIKESYSPRETVLTKISGEIYDILTKENIELKRGHIAVPFEYDIAKIQEEYYLWFITPYLENNYTLRIKGITTTMGGLVKKIDYEKNFSVAGNATYSIKPGFVSTTKDFEITAQLYEDEKKTIKVNFPYEQEITLKPGENILKFSITRINETGIYNITIGDYAILAYIMPNKTIQKYYNVSTTNITIKYEDRNYTKTNKTKKVELYCYEYPGTICYPDETCSGETRETLDGICCIGTCEKEKETGSVWLGYLLILVLIALLGYIGYRYYKTKKEGNENVLQKKVGEIEKRRF